MPDAPEGAFSGGVVGTWLDATPVSRFQTTDTSGIALTAYNNDFGRWVDRSGNGKDATTTATDSTRPFARNPASPNEWRFFGDMLDTTLTVAGAGGTNVTGFYLAFAGQPTSYYGELVSDVNTTNTGFRLRHDADGSAANGAELAFSAGTGSARVEVKIPSGGPRFANAPALTPSVIECWWDDTANTINIRRNGGTTVSATCSSVSAGLADLKLNANLAADQKGFEVYELVMCKNHLPSQTVRDDIRTYLTERITAYRDAQAAIASASATSAAALRIAQGQAALASSSEVFAAAVRVVRAQAAVDSASSLTAVGEAIRYAFGAAAIGAESALTAAAIIPVFRDGSAIIAPISSASARGSLLWDEVQDTAGAWTEEAAPGTVWTTAEAPSTPWT